MFEIVGERLAQSSDVIVVLGLVIFVVFKMLIASIKEAKEEREIHNEAIVKLALKHSQKTEELNADILKALIDSTSALVSIDKSYIELRNDINEKL